MEPAIVVLIVFGSVGLVIWRYIEARNKERMAMIEKGLSPADFKSSAFRDMMKPSPLGSLKWGLLACFVGMGLLVATWLERAFYSHDSVYPASMLIFGGLALIIFYFIAARKAKSEDR